MGHAYTLEKFRQDLARLAQEIETSDGTRLSDLRRMLAVVEAIPPAERESGSPFLTPSLRQQIAEANNISVGEFEEILEEYKRLALVIAELKRS